MAPAPGYGAMAPAPGMGPPWPYPEQTSRPTGSFDNVFGFGFLAGGVFALFIGIFVVSVAGAEPLTLLTLAMFVFTFPAIGISSLRNAAKNKRNAEQLSKSGVRCWGRILSSAPGGGSRSVNGMSWARMKITVEAFAAHDPRATAGYRQHAAGSRVADQVVIDWFISMFQMALLQPGYYCAFLLDPADPTKVHLDALANPQGQVIPLT